MHRFAMLTRDYNPDFQINKEHTPLTQRAGFVNEGKPFYFIKGLFKFKLSMLKSDLIYF